MQMGVKVCLELLLVLLQVRHIKLQCAFPDQVQNAKLVEALEFNGRFMEGRRLGYRCDHRYSTVGQPARICHKGQWTPIKCELITCPYVQTPEHGIRLDLNSNEGEVTMFACNEGYAMIGKDSLRCGADGKWKPGEPPVCAPFQWPSSPDIGTRQRRSVECPDLPNIKNGYISWRNDRTLALFECNEDGYAYILKGSKWRTCRDNGMWSGVQPTCTLARCPDIQLHNGIVEYVGEKTLAVLECNDDSDMFPESSDGVAFCTEREEWDVTGVTCERRITFGPKQHMKLYEITKVPGKRAGGLTQKRERFYGEKTFKSRTTFVAECDDRYEMRNGLNRAYSNKTLIQFRAINGTLNPALPSCTAARCNLPDRKPNSSIRTTDGKMPNEKVEHGTTIIQTCNRDYEFKNPSLRSSSSYNVTCNKGAIGSLLICIAKRCEIPEGKKAWLGTDGQRRHIYAKELVNNGHTVSVTCEADQELYYEEKQEYLDSFETTCTVGEWSSSPFPTCQNRRCPVPPYTSTRYTHNGKVKKPGTNLEHASQLRRLCDADYEDLENEGIVCANGKWTGTIACTPKRCTVPSNNSTKYSQDGIIVKAAKVKHDSHLKKKCNSGYEDMDGDIICNKGDWQGEQSCRPTRCNLPDRKPNSSIRTTDGKMPNEKVEHGTTIIQTCNRDYEFKNPSLRSSSSYNVTCNKGAIGSLSMCIANAVYSVTLVVKTHDLWAGTWNNVNVTFINEHGDTTFIGHFIGPLYPGATYRSTIKHKYIQKIVISQVAIDPVPGKASDGIKIQRLHLKVEYNNNIEEYMFSDIGTVLYPHVKRSPVDPGCFPPPNVTVSEGKRQQRYIAKDELRGHHIQCPDGLSVPFERTKCLDDGRWSNQIECVRYADYSVTLVVKETAWWPGTSNNVNVSFSNEHGETTSIGHFIGPLFPGTTHWSTITHKYVQKVVNSQVAIDPVPGKASDDIKIQSLHLKVEYNNNIEEYMFSDVGTVLYPHVKRSSVDPGCFPPPDVTVSEGKRQQRYIAKDELRGHHIQCPGGLSVLFEMTKCLDDGHWSNNIECVRVADYHIELTLGDRAYAGSSGDLFFSFLGDNVTTASQKVLSERRDRGKSYKYTLKMKYVGQIQKLTIIRNGGNGIYVARVLLTVSIDEEQKEYLFTDIGWVATHGYERAFTPVPGCFPPPDVTVSEGKRQQRYIVNDELRGHHIQCPDGLSVLFEMTKCLDNGHWSNHIECVRVADYHIEVTLGDHANAGSSDDLFFSFLGDHVTTASQKVLSERRDRGKSYKYTLKMKYVGQIQQMTITRNGSNDIYVATVLLTVSIDEEQKEYLFTDIGWVATHGHERAFTPVRVPMDAPPGKDAPVDVPPQKGSTKTYTIELDASDGTKEQTEIQINGRDGRKSEWLLFSSSGIRSKTIHSEEWGLLDMGEVSSVYVKMSDGAHNLDDMLGINYMKLTVREDNDVYMMFFHGKMSGITELTAIKLFKPGCDGTSFTQGEFGYGENARHIGYCNKIECCQTKCRQIANCKLLEIRYSDSSIGCFSSDIDGKIVYKKKRNHNIKLYFRTC